MSIETCTNCNRKLAINEGRQVKTNAPMARAFCRGCGNDTGWVPGRRADAAAAYQKLPAAKPEPKPAAKGK